MMTSRNSKQVDRSNAKTTSRRGVIAVMVAVLMIVLLTFISLCVDIGWATLTRSQLQHAADAAALAGVSPLLSNYSNYSIAIPYNRNQILTTAENSASDYSIRYAGYNAAGDVHNLALLATDVQFGYTDANNVFFPGASGYPNTVQVKVRRDNTANAPLPLFFASVMGTSNLSLTSTSSATIYTGLITAFNPQGGGEGAAFFPTSGCGNASGGYGNWGNSYASASAGTSFNCTLLPVAFDVNHWNQFLATGTSADGTTNVDGNNMPMLKIYPAPQNSPGNFGLLCIGPWTNATPVYENWILNGPSATDLQTLVGNEQFPVSLSTPKPWKGSPGLRTALSSYFAQIIGQPRLLPLFQPCSESPYQAASGSGSNTTYAIVGFVGVKVCLVSGSGSNLNISVQPCSVVDPTAVFDSATIYPAGAAPGAQLQSFTHPMPKFTK